MGLARNVALAALVGMGYAALDIRLETFNAEVVFQPNKQNVGDGIVKGKADGKAHALFFSHEYTADIHGHYSCNGDAGVTIDYYVFGTHSTYMESKLEGLAMPCPERADTIRINAIISKRPKEDKEVGLPLSGQMHGGADSTTLLGRMYDSDSIRVRFTADGLSYSFLGDLRKKP